MIDCPELRTLAYPGEYKYSKHFDVKNAETIRKLETDMVHPEWLARFKGVECLVTRQLEATSLTTLLSMPQLKELHYDQSVGGYYSSDLREDGEIDRLSDFVYEAKKLRGSDFRFTFSGFELTNVDVDRIEFGMQTDKETEETEVYLRKEYIYTKNYHLIESGALHFVSAVDYTLLLSHVTGEFPSCFSHKNLPLNCLVFQL